MTHSITDAVQRWQDGDPTGAEALNKLLQGFLRDWVRRQRDPRLRARIDSEGIVNAALNSFLAGAAAGKFPELRSRENVQALLATMALRTLQDEARQASADVRDLGRETSSVEGAPVRAPDARQPTPDRIAASAEFMERLPEIVRGTHPLAMRILELSLDNYSNNDIACELAIGVRSVQVIKNRMYQACARFLAGESRPEARRDGQSNQPLSGDGLYGRDPEHQTNGDVDA